MNWTCTECGRQYPNADPATEQAIKGGCFSCGCRVFQMPTMSGAARNQAPPTDGERRHKLMTQELRHKIPALSAPETADPTVWTCYFTPDSSWHWYVIAFDGDDQMFGLVDGLEVELGYFSLRELEEVRGKLGLPIERDLHWTPKPLSQVQDAVKRARHDPGLRV